MIPGKRHELWTTTRSAHEWFPRSRGHEPIRASDHDPIRTGEHDPNEGIQLELQGCEPIRMGCCDTIRGELVTTIRPGAE